MLAGGGSIVSCQYACMLNCVKDLTIRRSTLWSETVPRRDVERSLPLILLVVAEPGKLARACIH